jgi:NAD(P)-dependent dehydrogenase (short-subunit alcohol dehydrogenase family)
MNDGFAAYAGSKALLASYTSQLAKQHPNITTTILSPGWIKTAMTEGQGASEPPAEATVSLLKYLLEDLPESGWI